MNPRTPTTVSPTAATHVATAVDIRNLVVCILVPLGLMLLAWPFAEGGFVDDFSYIHMAKRLADTGEYAYNGWPTAMIGFQAVWASAWIRLFGFSFTLARLSVLPFVLLVPMSVYLLARRASLDPADSLFASLLTALNSWFVTLAPSFMTDVPSLGLLLASLYAFVQAVEAAAQRLDAVRFLGWISLGLICGLLGGTIRQTVWFAPLAGAAVLLFWPGVGPWHRSAALVCGVLGIATIIVGVRWFNSQPYAIPTRSSSLGVFTPADAASLIRTLARIFALCVAALAPILVYRLSAIRRWCCDQAVLSGMRPIMPTIFNVVLTAAVTLMLAFHPVMTPLLDRDRVTAGNALLMTVARVCRGVRGGCMLIVACFCASLIVKHRRVILARLGSMPPAIWVPVVYLIVYTAAALQAARTTGVVFDRYHLPTVALLSVATLAGAAAMALAVADQKRSIWGWVLLALVGIPSVIASHDDFAARRARLAAIAFLTGRGVPRERIMAGWDIDGWEQIELVGFMNDPRIRTPADAYRPFQPDGYPREMFIREKLSALTPEYIISHGRHAFPGDGTAFPRFPWTAWRPPFAREIVITHQKPR